MALGRERGMPVYEDLGSGCVVDLRPFGIDEPLVPASLEAGVDLVSFSGDKLLGGPQAGILAGKAEIVARLRRNPLFRALRAGQADLPGARNHAAPAAAGAMGRDARAGHDSPAWRGPIRARAEALVAQVPDLRAEIVSGASVIGGGATPEQSIPTWLIAIECPDAWRPSAGFAARTRRWWRASKRTACCSTCAPCFPEEEGGLIRALTAIGREER